MVDFSADADQQNPPGAFRAPAPASKIKKAASGGGTPF
jgi:hypothetical protein